MTENKKITLLGGDMRMASLATSLFSAGFEVFVFGFEKPLVEGIKKAKSLEDALENADFAFLPLPLSLNGASLFAPFYKHDLLLADILKKSDTKTVFFGGNIPERIKDGKHTFIDFAKMEEFQIKNAVPTVEGAISAIIENTDFTVFKSKILISGFGRIAKLLALRLKLLGAEISVFARKNSDRVSAEALGYIPLKKEEIKEALPDFDIVINTAPALIFEKEKLKNAKKETLFIDLASRPGGFDFTEGERLGLKILWLLSLPGKIAPKTAGEIIFDTVKGILKGENDDR